MKKFNKRATLIFAVCFMMLFALSSSVFAFDDPEMECMPDTDPPMFRHCMPAHPYCVFYEDLTKANVDEFGKWKWFDEDFGWQHQFPFYNMPGVHIVSVKLFIEARDVDFDDELDEVFADGVSLGYLEGENNKTRTTEFDVPVSLLCTDGSVDVFLDVDSANMSGKDEWRVKVKSSQLEVIYRCGRYRMRRMIICD